MSHPKVSICIPAYKQPELLKKALDSVLIQDYKDYEIIITDDSPDSLVEIVCMEYKKKGAPLRYIKNAERKGTPENWNEAIRHANGEYIKILHHDDWFLSEKSLDIFVSMLDNNKDSGFAFAGSQWHSPEGKLLFKCKASRYQSYRLRNDPDFLFAGNFISTPSATIFRKNMDIFFDNEFKWVVDFDFYIRVIKASNAFRHTTKPLVGILVQSKSQVTAECLHDKNIQIPEYFNLYEKMDIRSRGMKPYIFKSFWHLLDRFDIKSIEDLKNCGVKTNIPSELTASLWSHNSNVLSMPVFIVKKTANGFMRIYKILLSNFIYCIVCMSRFTAKGKRLNRN
jgi:glycosyltransferase involved in cell wall biosynthesis